MFVKVIGMYLAKTSTAELMKLHTEEEMTIQKYMLISVNCSIEKKKLVLLPVVMS